MSCGSHRILSLPPAEKSSSKVRHMPAASSLGSYCRNLIFWGGGGGNSRVAEK